MSEKKTYEGSCHCGKVKYRANLTLDSVIACNCSMCGRQGSLLTFVGPEDFELLSGEEALKDYRFNTKTIGHLFCTECGIRSFAKGATPDGKAMFAVNVRCVEGIDPATLKITHYDGKNV